MKHHNLDKVFRTYIIFFILVFFGISTLSGQGTKSEGLNHLQKQPKDSIKSPEDPDYDYGHFQGKERSDNFYDSLSQKAQNKRWSKELYNLLATSTPKGSETNDNENRLFHFAQYENKIIRNIEVKQLDVFGPSINDTARKPKSWIGRTGNSLNILTNKRFIINNTFFDEGEQLDPYIIADNERVIRNLPGIQDVIIHVIPTTENSDSVDILIITKDVLPYGISWEAFDVGYGEARIWNTNMLGLGHRFGYIAYYNFDREPKYGYNISYKINNLGTSFAGLEFNHTIKSDIETSNIILSRDFITPAIRFGGGISLGKVKRFGPIYTIDTVLANEISEYKYYDVWAGYSFPIKIFKNKTTRESFFIAIRNQLYDFLERPEITENSLYDYFNRNTYLVSTGLTWQGYHTTRLVYGFGDTEDLPFGAMLKLTSGFEKHEFNERLYLGTDFVFARYFNKFGYLSNSISIGGFYTDSIEQGLIKNDLLHFTPIFGNRRHHFRNFLNISYIAGINRFNDEFIQLEQADRVRGLDNDMFKGSHRFYASNEFVYYSPQYLYGFRFVYYAFADLAITNNQYNTLFKNPAYISTGIGVRIRNERLVFNTIQLQLCLFPNSPGINPQSREVFQFASYPHYHISDFADRKPQTINIYSR